MVPDSSGRFCLENRRRLALTAAIVVAGALVAVAWLAFTDDSTDRRNSAGTSMSITDSTSSTPSTSSDANSSTRPSGATSPPPAPGAVPVGVWAGEHLVLNVTESGGSAEFECASGALAEPLLLDTSSHFDASGSYRAQSGGPAEPGAPQPPAQPARFNGSIHGAVMDLTVVLTSTGATHGPFHLELGGPTSLEKCL
jgi:hypothetical protein